MTEVLTPSGVLLERPLVPGSAEWLQRMSASKIAAVVGLSPYESPFSLYHRMTGDIDDAPTDVQRRGHYLEPAILSWFADQRPDLVVTRTGTWMHRDRPWQVASPDALGIDAEGNVACVEAKSAAVVEGWGEDGSDEIPEYYEPQVQWQLDTLGVQVCHVAVILPFLQFRAYTVRYDPVMAGQLRDAAADFLGRVERRERPSIDEHTATYESVRALHPEIAEEAVNLDDDLGRRYLAACAAAADAQAEKRAASALVLDAMGGARDAYYQGRRVAYRSAKTDDSTPYLCTARGAITSFRSAA